MARVTRTIPDWERCIICKEHGRDGVIRHLRGCPDYVKPASTATSVRLGDVLRVRK